MTLMQIMSAISEMFEDFAIKLLLILPKVYLQVDVVASGTLKNSIKVYERANRNSATKITIK